MLYICFLIYNSIQKRISEEEIALISYALFVILAITIVFILFFITFQRRKNQLLIKQIKQKQAFEEELIKTQQEIQEETLKYIGRELHDNVGQLLAFSTMQMNAVLKAAKTDIKPKITNAYDALNQSLSEVRILSKSLNSDVIGNLGFVTMVKNEVARLNKSGLIEASCITEGKEINFKNKKDEIILFRIVQEFFSNTLKYAQAEHLKIYLRFNTDSLDIKVEDDGIGFNPKGITEGSGMINMQKRAELIGALYNLETKANIGTSLKVTYTYRKA